MLIIVSVLVVVLVEEEVIVVFKIRAGIGVVVEGFSVELGCRT